MSLLICQDHPTFLLKEKIQEVSQHFLMSFGLSYFQYLRCYADGSIGLLTNNTSIFEYFKHLKNTPVVFSSFTNEHAKNHSYWFLWDEALPESPVEIVRQKFKVHNGLTLIRRYKNYYDMIAVGLSYEQENAGSFYLNKLKAIEEFIGEFDRDNKSLLEIMNKNPIALPAPYRDVNYQKMCLSQIAIIGKYGQTYLTSQELAVLNWLVRGATYKEIAQLLKISARTVETYLQRIKQRTGYATPLQLKQLFVRIQHGQS